MPDLVELLRKAIQDSGMSIYALGKLSGVDQSIIGRILAGERDLSLVSADLICDALGLDLRGTKKSG